MILPTASGAALEVVMQCSGVGRMTRRIEKNLTYDQVAEAVVELGYRLVDEDESADIWEVASGIMAGAVQFWLDSHQPCNNPLCQVCEAIASPEGRLEALLREAHYLGEESAYYSSSDDSMTGTA